MSDEKDKRIEFLEVQNFSYKIKIHALKKHLREANRGAERLSNVAQLLAERMANQMRLRDDTIRTLYKERDLAWDLLKKGGQHGDTKEGQTLDGVDGEGAGTAV